MSTLLSSIERLEKELSGFYPALDSFMQIIVHTEDLLKQSGFCMTIYLDIVSGDWFYEREFDRLYPNCSVETKDFLCWSRGSDYRFSYLTNKKYAHICNLNAKLKHSLFKPLQLMLDIITNEIIAFKEAFPDMQMAYAYEQLSDTAKLKACEDYNAGWLETHPDEPFSIEQCSEILSCNDSAKYNADGSLIIE